MFSESSFTLRDGQHHLCRYHSCCCFWFIAYVAIPVNASEAPPTMATKNKTFWLPICDIPSYRFTLSCSAIFKNTLTLVHLSGLRGRPTKLLTIKLSEQTWFSWLAVGWDMIKASNPALDTLPDGISLSNGATRMSPTDYLSAICFTEYPHLWLFTRSHESVSI